jgi:iron complex transport system permease protein
VKKLIFLALISLGILFIASVLGEEFLFPLSLSEEKSFVYWQLRVPRVLVAFLAGAFLAVSGQLFQTITNNSLATPYTLGLSAGASLGGLISVLLNASVSFTVFDTQMIFCFVGSMLAVVLVHQILKWGRDYSSHSLVLAGLMVSLVFNSLILFVQSLMGEMGIQTILRFLIGDIDVVGFDPLWPLLPWIILFAIFYRRHFESLNLMTLGDEFSLTRGLDPQKFRNLVFFFISLMIAVVVSVVGPISFIGLVVPHFCRKLFGSNHRQTLPLNFLLGGSFLVFCDLVCRLLTFGPQISTGVVTSLVGAPLFILVLIRQNRARAF